MTQTPPPDSGTPSSLDKTIDIRHYLRLVWRRRGIILLCTITTFCAAFVALQFVPNQYESDVTLQIEESQVLSNALEDLMGGVMAPPRGRGVDEERLAKLAGRIRSRPFLERVVRLLQMHQDPMVRNLARERLEDHPELSLEEMAIRILVENLRARIRFRGEGPGIYRIVVADFSPQGAQLLARWISELFVQISNEDVLERLRTAHEFGSEQLELYKQQLREAEEALEAYEQNRLERTLTQRLVHGENLDLVESLHRRLTDEIARHRTRLREDSLALIELGLSGHQAELLRDESIRQLANDLRIALRADIRDRAAGRTGAEQHWATANGYAAPRRDLLQQVERAAANYYPAASTEMLDALARFVFAKVDLEAQLDALALLDRGLRDFRAQVESGPGGEIERARLEHDVAVNRELLQSFQAQLIASDISQAVELTKLRLKIQVLDPATLPLSPSHPERMKTLLAALFLGALIGAGFGFVIETTDPVLRTLDDFNKIAPEPVIGTTPLLGRKLRDERGWLRRHWVAISVVVVLLLSGTALLIRERVLHELVGSNAPVQMVEPPPQAAEGTTDEDA
ncbi:MAG: hypothetical protein GF330_08455 [Candidatus Eisenbacteria bacterium]|nr:hypothetical protein [Candidatus Eisenbacteria bacterium]